MATRIMKITTTRVGWPKDLTNSGGRDFVTVTGCDKLSVS